MTNEPLVSVLMITYNHGKYIEEGINGVLIQECDFDFELIIANDHSSDNTDLIIQHILTEHPKSKVVKYINRSTNVGMISNFIDSLSQSRGKYIAICEGDDYWTDPLKLQKQVNFLENNHEFSMVCHDALIIDEINNSARLFFTKYHQKQICSTKDALNIHFCPSGSILFRKQSILPYKNLPVKPMDGDHLLVQLISLSGLLYRMNEVMSVYRKHLKGISEIAKTYLKEVLDNRINSLTYLNKISDYKFQKNIRIEILIIKNRIALLKAKSKTNIIFLKAFRKFLGMLKRKI